MKELQFLYFFMVARIRGVGRAYNICPKGDGVSCGIHRINEMIGGVTRHRGTRGAA